MKPIRIALLLVATQVAACGVDPASQTRASAEPLAKSDEAPTRAAPSEKTALSQTKFGQPIAEGGATDLAAIAKDPTKFSGQKVRTEGLVRSVCKSAGCWMEIEDASGRAHVKMAGHSFYVPKNADGHRARVEGTVQGGPPQDECGAKDSCGGEGNGALAKLEIEATGVEFLD